jgi:hypothetical protein
MRTGALVVAIIFLFEMNGPVCDAAGIKSQVFTTTSNLPSYLDLNPDSANIQQGVATDVAKAVSGKDPIFGDTKKYPVDVINLELKKDEPGTLNDILKIIGGKDELISFQLFKRGEHNILSFRIQSKITKEDKKTKKKPSSIRRKISVAIKRKKIHARVMGRSETIFDITAPQDYSSRSKDFDYFYLSLGMPYNTHNLIVLTEVLKAFELNITSFLFPDYEDELKNTIFHFEVCIKKEIGQAVYGADAFPLMTELLKQAIIEHCDACTNKDAIVFERDTTIAEKLIEGLLEELAVDFSAFKEEFVDAFQLVSDKIPVLRKNHRTPYVVHLLKAVKILVNEFGVKDTVAIIALLLHDAVEDNSISLSELEKRLKNPIIIRMIELITRNYQEQKRFDREVFYLDEIANADGLSNDPTRNSLLGAMTKLCKIADRVQNLRSLDIGDDKFHRKIFFETLNTFIPNFIDHPEMNIAKMPEKFKLQYSLARDTLFAEVMLRGMRFGFINRDGTINRKHLADYLEEQSAYLSYDEDDVISSSYRYEIERRRTYEFYQGIIDEHKDYINAIYASIKLWELINTAHYQPIHDHFVSTPTKAPFFPKRIKSSTVVFIYRLFDFYKTSSINKNLETIFLKDISSFEILEHDLMLSFQELSKPENMKNYLIEEIAQKFSSYAEERRKSYEEIRKKIFRSVDDVAKADDQIKEEELLFSLFREVFIICMQGYTGRDFNEIYSKIPKRRGIHLERRLLPSGVYFESFTAVVDGSRIILKMLPNSKIDETYKHLYPGSSARDSSDIEKRRDCFAEIVRRCDILGDLSVKSLSADKVEVVFKKKWFHSDILVQEYVVPLHEYIRELFKMNDIEKIKQVLNEYFALQKKIWEKGYYDERGLLHNYGFNPRLNKVQILGLVNLVPFQHLVAEVHKESWLSSLRPGKVVKHDQVLTELQTSYDKIMLNNRMRLESIETKSGSKEAILSSMFKDALVAADPKNELSRIYREYKIGPDMTSSALRSA